MKIFNKKLCTIVLNTVKHLLLVLLLYLMNSCTSAGRKESIEIRPQLKSLDQNCIFSGKACCYSPEFQNRITASGEKYNSSKLTAAHLSLPFGTLVEVRNLQNDKTVQVIINDRGPYKADRIIDLSEAAFREIANIKTGLINVEITVLP